MIPTVGRIVHYRLTKQDADAINKRRKDALAHMSQHRENSNGVVVHIGNSAVNGQVLLDGSDTLWVTSVSEGEGERCWFVPPRVV